MQESLNKENDNPPEPRRTNLRDYYRHNILVFESRDNLQYRNFVYNELNAILTMISYDYLQATGAIPLINMISHSTGGPWNMMWANNHPHNVHSLFAIAGTFRGSEIGTAIREDWLAWYTFSIPHDMINNPSSFDNTDTEQRDLLMAGWQDAVNQNPKMRLFTLAGETCWYLLLEAAEPWTPLFYIMLSGVIANPLPPITMLPSMAPLVGTIAGQNLLFYILNNSRDEWFTEGAFKRIVLSDDVLVSKSSASANGFHNPNNNINRWTKVFGNHNVNEGLAQPGMAAVPHNYSPRDLDTLDRIVNNITTGTVLNVSHSGNDVTINGANATLNCNFDLPEQVFISGQYRNITAIGNSAFSNQTQMSQISIPASVTSIGGGAFRSCNNLASVTFESGSRLQSIGDYAFRYCPLTSIRIPPNVTNIGLLAFDGCSALESIEVEYGNSRFSSEGNCLIEIPYNSVILGCKNSIIPDGIKIIDAGAFAGCTGLTRITIPNGVTEIRMWAFANCINLENVVMPQSMKNIQLQAFGGCPDLKSITIPNGVTSIGDRAFENCINLTIYAEVSGPQSGWHSNWNPPNRPVFWGCTLSADKTYVVSFTKSSSNISNPNAANGINAPYRENYDFSGWAKTSGGVVAYTAVNINSAPNTTLYAVWIDILYNVIFDKPGETVSGDFNGDGRDEIAMIYDCGNGVVEIYMWEFNGLRATCRKLWNSQITKSDWDADAMRGLIICGDFNNDGRDEIAAIYDCGNGVVEIYMWEFDGLNLVYIKMWDSQITMSGWDASAMRSMVVNHENQKDTMAAIYDCGYGVVEIYIWELDGLGFTCRKLWNSQTTMSDWDADAMRGLTMNGDFNNDGIDEIAVLYDCGNDIVEIYVWELDDLGFTCRKLWNSQTTMSGWNANAMRGLVVSGNFYNHGSNQMAAIYAYGNGLIEIYVWELDGDLGFVCQKCEIIYTFV